MPAPKLSDAQTNTEADEDGWHLQIFEREWVVWGYGSSSGCSHIAPAENVIHHQNGWEPTRLPFELPKAEEWNKDTPPQEIRRVTCWGWRIRHNGLIHDTGWHLAETREQCLVDATADIETMGPRDRIALKSALNDIREYGGGLW
jgi:hypothetical protein